MKISSAANRAAGIAAGMSLLLAAGCAGLKGAAPGKPPPPATAPASTTVVELPAASVPETPPAPTTKAAPDAPAAPVPQAQERPVPAPAPAPGPAARPAAPKVPRSTAATTQAATAKAQTPARVQPAPAPAAVPTPSPAPVAAKPAAPPLDLKSLETRLRETKAVGVFTKISLKNQVDDLLAQFRAYHQHETTTTLAALRQAYNLLLLKVLALLQDSDPSLARDIVASREAIWGILEDPKRFADSNLMAGVMP